MIEVNYKKRKNVDLFKSLEENEEIQLVNSQNYIPLYRKIFALNETNYNTINLNHKWYLNSVLPSASASDTKQSTLFRCTIDSITNDKQKEVKVFFKLAPLLNPFKYLTGKYNINDENLFKLPTYNNNDNVMPSIMDINNSAYVDGHFTFLTSMLIHNNHFIHGVDYYGSFLAHKINFKLIKFI